jgi:hypothetical protein
MREAETLKRRAGEAASFKERECKFCGSMFIPEARYQPCCDDDCSNAFLALALSGGRRVARR